MLAKGSVLPRPQACMDVIAMRRCQPLLTIDLEDYYQSSAFHGVLEPRHWTRFERRLGIGLERALGLLDDAGARATVFVSAWVAEVAPDLVRDVASRGHEVASRGSQLAFRATRGVRGATMQRSPARCWSG